MRVRVLYFASVRERLGHEQEWLDFPRPACTVDELERTLAGRGAAWAQVFGTGSKLLAAVNQTMARRDTTLADGDEVAFFPPVTGG